MRPAASNLCTGPSRRNGIPPQPLGSRDEGADAAPRRILIVEDEIFIQLDLERELTAAGFQIVGIADNAAEALRLAEREQPDAVLMDIRLRGARDGLDAALELWDASGSVACSYPGTSTRLAGSGWLLRVLGASWRSPSAPGRSCRC
jgi:hypothetical protein